MKSVLNNTENHEFQRCAFLRAKNVSQDDVLAAVSMFVDREKLKEPCAAGGLHFRRERWGRWQASTCKRLLACRTAGREVSHWQSQQQ